MDRTQGELQFEAYLRRERLRFERVCAGPERAPDYRLKQGALTAFCEVKDLVGSENASQGVPRSYDPFARVRRAIKHAAPQFRSYREYPCVLVLHNLGDWDFRDRPWAIFGAMLGNPGFEWTVAPAAPRPRSVLLGGGRMQHNGRAQNTTISAVAVLSEIELPSRRFELEAARTRRPLNARVRPATVRELAAARLRVIRRGIRATLRRRPRLSVFENPHARIPWPPDFFDGPFDARYRCDENPLRSVRVFAGAELQAHERREAARELDGKIHQFVQRVVERFDPQRVVLFGSQARGDAKPESDVDLLVLFRGDTDASNKALAIRRWANPDFAMDLITRSVGVVERGGDALVASALRDGKTLYDARR